MHGLAPDGSHIGCRLILLGGEQAKPPGRLEDAPQGGEHAVGGGGLILFSQEGAQEAGVLEAQGSPVEGEGVGQAVSQQGGDSVQGIAQGAAGGSGKTGEVDGSRMAVEETLRDAGQSPDWLKGSAVPVQRRVR